MRHNHMSMWVLNTDRVLDQFLSEHRRPVVMGVIGFGVLVGLLMAWGLKIEQVLNAALR